MYYHGIPTFKLERALNEDIEWDSYLEVGTERSVRNIKWLHFRIPAFLLDSNFEVGTERSVRNIKWVYFRIQTYFSDSEQVKCVL